MISFPYVSCCSLHTVSRRQSLKCAITERTLVLLDLGFSLQHKIRKYILFPSTPLLHPRWRETSPYLLTCLKHSPSPSPILSKRININNFIVIHNLQLTEFSTASILYLFITIIMRLYHLGMELLFLSNLFLLHTDWHHSCRYTFDIFYVHNIFKLYSI